ncbi:hypothetical protein PGTUg99_006505 [Puccinia graminis f. sp. tritici]|uniref:Uncharacterized protein n=1 Tax=Puccinia graminis f. sp. tritici TaxID=56615 RepID=A0A5B0SGW1_PUCGR|nr:hypothetical protein PGTUg99_006505 [Puccinia graminis f. sp. tritici]
MSARLPVSPSGTLTSGPDVSGLNLASDVSGFSIQQPQDLAMSAQPSGTAVEPIGKKKRRSRRTQKEMAIYRAKQAQIKKVQAQQKAKDKRLKGHARGGKSARSTRSTAQGATVQSASRISKPGSAPASSQTSVPDANPLFNSDDYENVCGYLEEESNYTRLYGDGSKTTVGTTKVTKAAAYDMFAIFINDNSNHRLCLTGSQLRQRIDGYKKRFMKAKDWAEQTGAGIEEGEDLPTLAELLEKKCPCYERMYAIFGGKANVTPLAQFDSGVGADLYMDMTEARGVQSRDLLPEVFFSGWEEAEDEQPPSGLTTPAGLLDLNRCSTALENLTGQLTPTPQVDPELNDEELPPPLDFSGSAMDPSPSVTTQILRACVSQGSAGVSSTPVSQVPTSVIPRPSLAGTSRRAFPNQRSTNPSPAAPVRDTNTQGKTTLASAFENSNSEKFVYLKQHMAWEKEKEDNRLSWEKEKYNKELAHAKDGAEGQSKLAALKLKAAQGKSAAEVEGLLKAIYG